MVMMMEKEIERLYDDIKGMRNELNLLNKNLIDRSDKIDEKLLEMEGRLSKAENSIEYLLKDNDSNKSLWGSFIVGVCVAVAVALIQLI